MCWTPEQKQALDEEEKRKRKTNDGYPYIELW